MVLDFGYYHTGLPGLPLIVELAVKQAGCLILVPVLAYLCAVFTVRMANDHVAKVVLGGVFVLGTLLIGARWHCALWARRPGSRKRLLSLPGGPAFAALSRRLGRSLRTVWLGEGANCHCTDVAHPFHPEGCPSSLERDCWQCLYILQVKLTVDRGEVPVAATTNLMSGRCPCRCLSRTSGALDWERRYGPGSSEVPGEQEDLSCQLPADWGSSSFRAEFHGLASASRAAQVHQGTGEPLGVGCRWERRLMHDLSCSSVLVVAEPPAAWALLGNAQAAVVMDILSLGLWGMLCFALDFILYLVAVVSQDHPMGIALALLYYLRQRLALFSHMLECSMKGYFECSVTGYFLVYVCVLVGGVIASTVFAVWVCGSELAAKARGQMRPLTLDPRYLSRGCSSWLGEGGRES